MSVFNFFLPGNFGITQDAELYVMTPVNLGDREYHWRINCGSSLNDLFSTRTYIQNSTNQENVDICLAINSTYVNTLFNSVLNTSGGTGPDFVGIDTAAAPFSQRLLEMTALKIFKHAKARAAIGNDNDFDTLYSNVTTHILNSFTNKSIKLNFFEQYIASRGALGNSLPDDLTSSTTFNLASTEIFIYGTLAGNITDTTPTTAGGFPFCTSYATNMRIELSTVS